jgi:hypothetical protein
MNKHILLVMKWLNDKDSVTQEELVANRRAAAQSAYADDSYNSYYDAYHANVAYVAAAYAYYATVAHSAERKVNYYFEITGEDKQTYINELEK